MPVRFRELAGSPEEEYTLDGFRARRTFLVPWEERHAFAAEILGIGGDHGARPWAPYPGKDGVYAVTIRFSPADPEAILTFSEENPSARDILAEYSGSFAKAMVEYTTVSPFERSDAPTPPDETHLSYRMDYGIVERPILASGYFAEDDPQTPLPSDLPLTQVIPFTDHHLMWRQVVGPPWQAIRELQGLVNDDTFLGAAPGTLLFLGATTNKLFRGNFDQGLSPFCWEITYHFRELAIKHGEAVYGWNAIHRTSPAGYVNVTDPDGPIYESGDFRRLFIPEL
ncbi:MAG: hypothetical protein ACUVQG_03890 [Thermogutta sp.]